MTMNNETQMRIWIATGPRPKSIPSKEPGHGHWVGFLLDHLPELPDPKYPADILIHVRNDTGAISYRNEAEAWKRFWPKE